jgi:hypothetical protein
MKAQWIWLYPLMIVLTGCGGGTTTSACDEITSSATNNDSHKSHMKNTFADDLAFLKKHTEIVLLKNSANKAQVAVAPQYQGRVMTSAANGEAGLSFGWINRDVIASGKRQPHMTVFGGEDRFWLGPEGGQYSIYFQPKAPFDFDHWQVPDAIDWGEWRVVDRDDSHVRLQKDVNLTNYSGTTFSLRIDRTVRLLDDETVAQKLGIDAINGVQVVGYESINTITNTGKETWTKDNGLLSIWILGMYNPSPQTTVVVPFQKGSKEEKGPIVNDDYFGKVTPDRLVVADGVLFFRADAKQRGKIGIPKPRAMDTVGSYDAAHQVLTVVQYTLPPTSGDYVNSKWKIQSDPYNGDVVNSYNDGAPEKGAKALGGFYELETSSPAAALAPGEQLDHIHRTIHIQGSVQQLDAIALKSLGPSIQQITNAFSAQKAGK